jgi:hypothetical protein
MKTYKVISMVCAIVALFFACTPINNAGTVTQTGNPTVAGILYAPGGNAAAKGVKVTIRPKASFADTAGTDLGKRIADTASVITDSAGQFSFDSTLDTGIYVIEAISGNNAALIDSVVVKKKTATNTLPPDTLKPMGVLKGIIKLAEGGDPHKVFVLALGIDRFARVNADGSFEFSGLAEAKYHLRLISSLDDYGVLDTPNVAVTAAETTDVKTIELPFTGIPITDTSITGIPAPKNVTISYDTLTQTVKLSWNNPDTARIKKFNIYRGAFKLNSTPFLGTTYTDATGSPDETYEYYVAAVVIGDSLREGEKSEGVTVHIVTRFVMDTVYNKAGSGPGQLSHPNDIAVSGDGDIYIADMGNDRVLVFDSIMTYKRQIGANDLQKPTKVSVDGQGNVAVINNDSAIYLFNSSGALTKMITDSVMQYNGVYDLDAKDSLLYLTNTRTASILNYGGGYKRTWDYGSAYSDGWLVKGDSDKIFVSLGRYNNTEVRTYDTSGNILFQYFLKQNEVTSIAFDEKKKLLYAICNFLDNVLHVVNENDTEIANYKIGNRDFYTAMALQKNGTILLVLSEECRILRLRPRF